MGTILQASCAKCGSSTELFVGGGLMDCKPRTAMAAAPGDTELTLALQSGARFQIERAPAVCRRCQKIFSMPYITYWPKSEEAKHTASACPECGGLLTRVNPNAGPVPCPVCGTAMGFAQTGHWD